jgi:putative DNA primase/helicase
MAKASKTYLPYAYRLLQVYHACVVEGGLWLFDPSSKVWLHGREVCDRIVTRLDNSTRRTDRSEIYDLAYNLAPVRGYSDPALVQVANGVLDVRTGELHAPSADFVVPNVIPWPYDPAAGSDAVKRYLDEVSDGDPETLAQIEEMLGAAICRIRIPYFWVITSPAGAASTGKSTLGELAIALVGESNASALDTHEMGDHFQISCLRQKLLTASLDTSAAPVPPAALGVLKKIPTQDLLHADVKNGVPVDFHPYATVLIVANRPPAIIRDEGLARRAVTVVLHHHFPESGREPVRELANDSDMEALLNHAVTGVQRLLKKGPTMGAASIAATAAIRQRSSTVLSWLDDAGFDAAGIEGRTCQETYLAYQTWCDAGGERPEAKRDFEDEVQRLIPDLSVEKCRWQGQPPQRRWIAS